MRRIRTVCLLLHRRSRSPRCSLFPRTRCLLSSADYAGVRDCGRMHITGTDRASAWSLGPSIAHTLFDFGRRRAEVQQTEATYDELVATYRQTSLTAFQEVEDNLAALRVLAQEATEQDVAVQSAEQSLSLEIDRY